MTINNTEPLVSVAITLYNRAEFIAESIESVLVQTWQNLEILVVDDCSTDGSYAIAERYLSDPRVRLIRNDRNLGDYANRNRAAQLATGELLKFHDSDDVMYPHCVRMMATPLIAEPRAALALTASRSWEGGPVPMLLEPEVSFEREFLGIGMFNGGPGNALFRLRDFIEHGGFEDVGGASDHLFWARFLALHPVLLVHADLYYYRRHPGQQVVTGAPRLSDAHVEGLIWRLLSDGKTPLKGAVLERAKSNWLWILAKQTRDDLKSGRFDLIRIRMGAAGLTPSDWLKYFRRPSRTIAAGTPQLERRASS